MGPAGQVVWCVISQCRVTEDGSSSCQTNNSKQGVRGSSPFPSIAEPFCT